jgi:menaquinone-specific isochorismate synthase
VSVVTTMGATGRDAGDVMSKSSLGDPHRAEPPAVRLSVRTVPVAHPGPLLELMPHARAFAWLHRGEGMIGWGEAARYRSASLAGADQWWSGIVDNAVLISDIQPGPPGAGLIAFGSFVFDPAHTAAESSLVVPKTVLRIRHGRAWLTTVSPTIGQDTAIPDPAPLRMPQNLTFTDGALSAGGWALRVAEAVRRITAGQLDKVVLARDLVAVAEEDIDPRWLLRRLAEPYARCWTFHVDGLIGASPEMLVRRDVGLATSRVLAGTIRRTGDGGRGRELAAALRRSGKDLGEHEFAVRSVAQALAPFCLDMHVPDAPFVLGLPNVLHLASDVTAVAKPGASSLALAAALHPSAAVCGTPTDVARSTIAELEQMDRGRYLGPVGWVDARGDGEWVIALRCGQQGSDPRRIRLYAGGGIVAESDPAEELAETEAKLMPMRYALGSA